jgi:hypothetical protein
MNRNVAVEIYFPDGSASLFVGRLVSRDKSTIILIDVAWISDTGRRSQFFSGLPDDRVEIEPYPDGVTVELPARGAVVIDWPHALLRDRR